MGGLDWPGLVGLLLVVGGIAVRRHLGERGNKVAFPLEVIVFAGWMLVVFFLIKPLVPRDVLGTVILVVLALSVLAVPVVVWRRRGRR